MCFSPYLGVGGGGLPRGLGHNLLMQFSSLGSSKMEFSKTDFFDTLTIQNDQISYVKHVLAHLYVFFTLFGCWGGAQKRLSLSPVRGALPKAIEFGASGGLFGPFPGHMVELEGRKGLIDTGKSSRT